MAGAILSTQAGTQAQLASLRCAGMRAPFPWFSVRTVWAPGNISQCLETFLTVAVDEGGRVEREWSPVGRNAGIVGDASQTLQWTSPPPNRECP